MNIRRSMLLSLIERYGALIVGTVSVVVLARILTPTEIGVYSVAAGIVAITQTLRDFGVANYILQEKDLTQERLSTAFAIALGTGVAFAAAMIGSAGWLAKAFGGPELTGLIRFLAINFLTIPVSSVAVALLRRRMNFGALMWMGIGSSLAGASTAIGFGLAGFGAHSLAWSSNIGVLASIAIAALHLKGDLLIAPSLRRWRDIAGFGLLACGAQMLKEGVLRLPELAISRVLGFAAVGYYSRGNSLITLFNRTALHAVWPVTVSAFAAMHRDGQSLRRPFVHSLEMLTGVAWPLLVILTILAHPLMLLAFGDQWGAAVPVARVLCVAAAFSVGTEIALAVLSGCGRMRATFMVSLVSVLVLAVLLFLFARNGILAAAMAMIAVTAVQSGLALALAARVAGIGVLDILAALPRSAAVATATAALPLAAAWIEGFDTAFGFWKLAVVGLGSLLVWLAALFVTNHPLAGEVVRVRLAVAARLGRAA